MRTVLAALLLGTGLVAVAPAAQAEQVERQISIGTREPQENAFVIKGKVSPSTGEPVKARVEVKHCRKDRDCGAKWQRYEAMTTNARGRYSQRVTPPRKGYARVYYRVSTRETKKFLAAVSAEVFIRRTS